MNSDIDRLRKLFPARFANLGFICPPEDSIPIELAAYRLCKNKPGALDSTDFLPYNFECSVKATINNASDYSVSFFKTPQPLERIKCYPRHKKKCIVYGKIKKMYGFSKQGEGENCHIDLWLYEKAQPWADFCDM